MTAHVWWLLTAGIVAAATSILAARSAVALKRREGRSAAPLLAFWGTVAAYMVCFTALRVAYAFDVGGTVPWFYAQTLAGASTLVALAYIFCGILVGPHAARWGAEIAAMAAFVTVFLIFHDGLEGPFADAWTIEYLPANAVARGAVAVFYVVLPVALAVLVMWASRSGDAGLARRTRWFAFAVILIYVPNAGKYVVDTSGPLAPALATVMAVGAVIGWRSYHLQVDTAK